ncbi:MAG TPA: cation transporter [Gemmatimonadaceae bacterium]
MRNYFVARSCDRVDPLTEVAELPRPDPDRAALVRRGIWLSYATIGYNSLEAIGSLVAGIIAGSVALVGFGIDSVIEVTASVAAQWRLRSDINESRRERVELLTMRIVGVCFIALAIYILFDAANTLVTRAAPDRSVFGILILALSVIVMPILARSKKRVARELTSVALEAEATQTSLCAYLSVIGLAGVLLNGILGWWWADPVAALLMVPIIVREGIEGIRAEACC